MVKVILFDFWGTLVETGIQSPIKQVKEILGIDLPFSDYVVRMERAMMTEKFATLKEAFEAVCKEFQVECPEEKMELLIGLWNKSWMLAQPYEDVAQELPKLKEKCRLILISNTDCFSVDKVLEKFALTPLFDKIFLSYQMHSIKTDKNFFKQVLDELGVRAEDCLVVGDSIQSDIVAAKKAGIRALLIDRRNTRNFHLKIESLKALERFL
ncbi:MAG: HAD family hydrolase [Nanoarchaeota archaeon]